MTDIYGDLGQDAAFAAALTALWERGTRAVLTDFLAV